MFFLGEVHSCQFYCSGCLKFDHKRYRYVKIWPETFLTTIITSDDQILVEAGEILIVIWEGILDSTDV